jgi:DHA2 family multidrug resistance protein
LVGVLLAALTSGINDRVTDTVLVDILGIFGLGHDQGTWISTAYAAAEVSAMMLSPWLAMTFSIRRWAIAVTCAFTVFGILIPLAPNFESLVTLRVLQGLAGGALPPLLMTAAAFCLRPDGHLWPQPGPAPRRPVDRRWQLADGVLANRAH